MVAHVRDFNIFISKSSNIISRFHGLSIKEDDEYTDLQVICKSEIKEKIKIKTWILQISKARATRENLILDEQGDIIGSSQGKWAFFDINKRRAIMIFNDILEQWKLSSPENIKKNKVYLVAKTIWKSRE